jgi:hypothetical protein
MQFLGFSNHEKGAPRQILKWSMVCSTFSRNGWSVVRSALLAKGGTSKKRPSPHLHKVLTWSNKVSPWTLLMTLICPQLEYKSLWENGIWLLMIHLCFQEYIPPESQESPAFSTSSTFLMLLC